MGAGGDGSCAYACVCGGVWAGGQGVIIVNPLRVQRYSAS